MKLHRLFLIFFFVFEASSIAQAETPSLTDHFGLMIGTSLGVGQLGSRDADLSDRWMNSLSGDIFGGYKFGSFMVGLHGNYRTQGQMTAVSSVGGTNLKGNGSLLGLGLSYRHSQELYVMGAVDFVGAYSLSLPTLWGDSDEMTQPLGFRVKGGYFFTEKYPLSMDIEASHLTYKKFHVGGVDHDWTSSQWLVGVGLTYHFGMERLATVATESTVSAKRESSSVITSDSQGELLRIIFEPYSIVLSERSEKDLRDLAERLKASSEKLHIKGHSDTSGDAKLNEKLGRERAFRVKNYLKSQGIDEARLQAEGFGSREPLGSNETAEGRATNRRVDIYPAKESLGE